MHFLVMTAFAVFVAVIFAGINSDIPNLRDKAIYGAKVFGSFIGIGLLIAWLLYFIPR